MTSCYRILSLLQCSTCKCVSSSRSHNWLRRPNLSVLRSAQDCHSAMRKPSHSVVYAVHGRARYQLSGSILSSSPARMCRSFLDDRHSAGFIAASKIVDRIYRRHCSYSFSRQYFMRVSAELDRSTTKLLLPMNYTYSPKLFQINLLLLDFTELCYK